MDFSKKYLDSGKFRVSWGGELGNQNISSDYYPYLTDRASGKDIPYW